MNQPAQGEYTDAITRFFLVKRDYSEINHGPEPDPKDYHFVGEQNEWLAQQIRKAVIKDLARRA